MRRHCARAQVGLLMDLTNTWRYYERDEIDELGVWHLKVPPRLSRGNPAPSLQFIPTCMQLLRKRAIACSCYSRHTAMV